MMFKQKPPGGYQARRWLLGRSEGDVVIWRFVEASRQDGLP